MAFLWLVHEGYEPPTKWVRTPKNQRMTGSKENPTMNPDVSPINKITVGDVPASHV